MTDDARYCGECGDLKTEYVAVGSASWRCWRCEHRFEDDGFWISVAGSI